MSIAYVCRNVAFTYHFACLKNDWLIEMVHGNTFFGKKRSNRKISWYMYASCGLRITFASILHYVLLTKKKQIPLKWIDSSDAGFTTVKIKRFKNIAIKIRLSLTNPCEFDKYQIKFHHYTRFPYPEAINFVFSVNVAFIF